MGPIEERLSSLLDVFSPWEGITLTYRQLAAELGPPVTEAAVKKWPRRKRFPADAARLIVARARERGLTDVTLDWVLWGEGQGPRGRSRVTSARSIAQRSAHPRGERQAGPERAAAPQE